MREMPAPPALAALKPLLTDTRDLSACISSYSNKVLGPLKDQNAALPIKTLRNWKRLQPQEARHSCQHILARPLHSSEHGQKTCYLDSPAGSFPLPIASLSELQRSIYFPWRFLLDFHIKAREWQGQGDLHHFSRRVQLPPPSLLCDPASTYDAFSHHLHHL